MPGLYERMSQVLLDWEVLGRGTLPVADEPVCLEPPYIPFPGYRQVTQRKGDDGREESAVSGFLADLSATSTPAESEEEDFQHIFEFDDGCERIEFQLALPRELEPDRRAWKDFIAGLVECTDSVDFLNDRPHSDQIDCRSRLPISTPSCRRYL